MSLLFEDLFKRLNSDLKRQADSVLSKANRATQVCAPSPTLTHTDTSLRTVHSLPACALGDRG